MSRSFLPAWGAGLALVVALIAAVFYLQRNDHLAPKGQILKVRTVAADPQNSIAILDLQVQNDSAVAMEVRDVSVSMKADNGPELKGTLMASSDTQPLPRYYPGLGKLLEKSLVRGTRIPAHGRVDLVLAAGFAVPRQTFDKRPKLSVNIQDRSMLNYELLEKPQ